MSSRHVSLFHSPYQRRSRAFYRVVALFLVCVLGVEVGPAFADAPKAIDANAVKVKVEKLGVGEHVMVKLAEGRKLHGRIAGIEGNSFKLKPDKSKAEIQVPYDNVLKIKKNPGALTWMAVGAVIVIIIIVATR
jgi:sporulation protein YlmC with PRC-barrel domain